jgi:methionyl-tRNA formyltransferase
MAMEAGLDSGPVYASETIPIGEHETAGELHDRLASAGAALLLRHLGNIVDGTLVATQQDEGLASYAAKISTADAVIDWRQSAADVDRKVRAYNPVPGAWFMLADERIKCWRSQSAAGVDAPPGTVVVAGQDDIVVACGEGALRLETLQRPGKRAVTAREFATQVDLVGRQL